MLLQTVPDVIGRLENDDGSANAQETMSEGSQVSGNDDLSPKDGDWASRDDDQPHKAMELSVMTDHSTRKHAEIRTDPNRAFLLAAENLQAEVLLHFLWHEAYMYKDTQLGCVKSLRAMLRASAAKGSATAQASKNHNERKSEKEDSVLQAFKLVLENVQLTAAEYAEIWTEAVTNSSETVIQHLLETKPFDVATVEMAEVIIEKGTARV